MKIAETPKIKNHKVVPNNGSRGERTFLGGFQLRTRMSIFWALGFLSLLALGAIFIRIDAHINTAVDNWKGGQEALVLMAQIQSGIERIQMLEKKYLLLKKRQIADTFSREISRIDGNIKKLYKLPYTEPIRQKISTLRDGLEQYSEQFLNLDNIEGKIGMTKPMGLSPVAEDVKRDQFAEILTYITSSTDTLWKFVNHLDLSMTRRFERARELGRYAIPGAVGAIFLWFMLIGILLFRSVVAPIQTLASAGERIALGDRSPRIPARGNADASGRIACALEKWIEDLAEADSIQQDLEQIRQKQKSMIPGREGHSSAAAYPIRASGNATIFEDEKGYDLDLKDVSSNPSGDNLRITSKLVQNSRSGGKSAEGDSIRQISERLTYFSDYITEAALDVERTEALTRYLSEASSHIEILGKFVLGVQDQVNLLTSNFSPRDIGINGLQDPNLNHRLNSIRETMEQAGLTLQSVRILIEKVNVIGQEIAKTSSDQALEANNKLLSQSRNLQGLLDDIMARINVNPGPVGSLLEGESVNNKS